MKTCHKLGVGLIVKNEEMNLPKCLDSVRDIADVICIIDTGSTDKTENIAQKWAENHQKTLLFRRYLGASEQDENGNWYLIDWAKARNQYTEDLDDKVDFILSMDADDSVVDQNALKELLTLDFDVFGIQIHWPDFKYTQHRFWRTRKGYRFKYPIFEYLNFPKARVLNSKVSIQTTPPGAPSVTRNLRILEREYKNNPDNRILFYYGNTLKEKGDYIKAIEIYRQYLSNPITFWDEYMRVRIYLMRCLRAAGLKKEAYQQGFMALYEDRRFSEIPTELAYMYFDDGEWNKAMGMCYFAIQNPPDTQLFLQLDKYRSEPLRILKLCINKSRAPSTSPS